MQGENLIYDGTFDGFLCAVFHVFEHKLTQVHIQNKFTKQDVLFYDNVTIITEQRKANRVWKGVLSKTGYKHRYQLYSAFLSEQQHIELLLLDGFKYIFGGVTSGHLDYSHPSILQIAKIAKQVGREKHRMEAFVRFRLLKDGIYFASIEPDFNVLPLILKHFKNRYADQKWMIYDIKRHYGMYYDLSTAEIIDMEFPKNFDFTKTSDDFFTNQELEFQTLWQDYFKSTNITSRKNLKLHRQHVPKRYWKYLSEKQ